MPHCRVQSPGEINVMLASAILKMVFRNILFIFVFLNAVWALTSGGFRIVSVTLVMLVIMFLYSRLIIVSYLPPTKEEVNAFARVRLSVTVC